MGNRSTVEERGREGRLVEIVGEREGGKWAIGLLWKDEDGKWKIGLLCERKGERGDWWRLWKRERVGNGQ